MHKLQSSLLYLFSKPKQINIKNFFTNNPLAHYTTPTQNQLTNMLDQLTLHRTLWSSLLQPQRNYYTNIFLHKLQSPQLQSSISHLLSSLTGKQISQCYIEYQTAIKILQNQLVTSFIPKKMHQGEDYYYFEPFNSIVSIYDHRYPILSTFKYLGLALKSRNAIILRPHQSVLPITKIIEDIWQSCCQDCCIIKTLYDADDPTDANSVMMHLMSQSSFGFINFSGRIQPGLDFHYVLASKSSTFTENQFLLMSSDSAYVKDDLTKQQLKKAIEIVARGVFSNAGNNFNSIKRVYVDCGVVEQFIEGLVECSKMHRPPKGESMVNDGTLAPIFFKQQYKQAEKKLAQIEASKQFTKIVGGTYQYISSQTADLTHNYILPTIYKLTTDYPNYPYQSTQYMFPICFVSSVQSVQQCIQKINSSSFGITCSLFTSKFDTQNVQQFGKRVDVGTINVNTWQITDGITYSGRKRSGKAFSMSPFSINNITRTKAVSFAQ